MTSQQLKARKHCCKSGCLHCPYGFTLKKFGLTFEKVADLNDKESVHNVFLKGELCAIIKVDQIRILELQHVDGFEDQGLFKEMIESYFY